MSLSRIYADPIIPRAEPDDDIVCIFADGNEISINPPCKGSDVECPICCCIQGYYNKRTKTWFCHQCGLNAKKPSGTSFVPQKMSTTVLLQTIGVPTDLLHADFSKCDSFALKGKSSADFITLLSKWARKPLGFVLFAGTSGRGKTYASCCVLSMSVKYEVPDAYFINVSDLYVKWKDSFNSGASELHLLTSLGDKKLLVIDDIGVRTPTEGFLEFIYLLLNKRRSGEKGTIITTNLTSAQMYEKLGDALGSRISGGEIIVFEGPDRRKKLGF